MKEFTATSCIAMGWETFKRRPWFLIGVPLLAFVVYAIISGAFSELQKLGAIISLIVFFANIYISTVYKMGSTNFSLKAVSDTSSLKVMDYWHPRPFWQYLGASILVMLCALAAFILALIASGILAGIAYLIGGSSAAIGIFIAAIIVLGIAATLFVVIVLMFVPYIVITEQPGPVVALKKSAHITKGHRLTLLWFVILCLLLNLVGLICIVVGLLVTIPVTAFAVVHAYRLLSQKAGPAPAV